jgi:hypothetical protein
MVRRQKKAKRSKAKSVLRLPDLEQSKNAVLNSLAAATSQESYGHAINEFIGWYCSELRLAFNRTVVLRYSFSWNRRTLLPRPSTCAWLLCGGSLMRQSRGASQGS